ncbi:hypothetical protein LAZ67_13000869 [Cordylochernes scorpioides]|uniref:Uncharacterized protein n=1 Tax=Cordylochernes scorpioides TaxID=51811 RepID=A0ABY6L464_9ARAC|nr:hypothetical protein LAZ67_13000869 [Cordylochernes scorpioides]
MLDEPEEWTKLLSATNPAETLTFLEYVALDKGLEICGSPELEEKKKEEEETEDDEVKEEIMMPTRGEVIAALETLQKLSKTSADIDVHFGDDLDKIRRECLKHRHHLKNFQASFSHPRLDITSHHTFRPTPAISREFNSSRNHPTQVEETEPESLNMKWYNRHLDVDNAYLYGDLERIINGEIKIVYILTKENMADVFTKTLSKVAHKNACDFMNYSPVQRFSGGMMREASCICRYNLIKIDPESLVDFNMEIRENEGTQQGSCAHPIEPGTWCYFVEVVSLGINNVVSGTRHFVSMVDSGLRREEPIELKLWTTQDGKNILPSITRLVRRRAICNPGILCFSEEGTFTLSNTYICNIVAMCRRMDELAVVYVRRVLMIFPHADNKKQRQG